MRQALAWPEGSEESALVLAAVARFLAAHTPTRRELPTVVRTAARLRRGDPVHEAADAPDPPPPSDHTLLTGTRRRRPPDRSLCTNARAGTSPRTGCARGGV